MVRQVAVAVVVVAGCYHGANETACSVTCGPGVGCPNGLACVDGLCRGGSSDTCGGTTDDASYDAFAPLDGCITYGTGLFQWQTCALDNNAYTMPSTFDTDTQCTAPFGHLVMPSGSPICIVYAHQLTIGNLSATGGAPLVLIGDDLAVSGMLDVSGGLGSNASNGAGSGFACILTGTPLHPGAGGAGGAGDGGGGSGGASNDGTKTPGTSPRPLVQLQGGCPGVAGDNASAASAHGLGGPGGGVLYLIGRSSLTISDTTILAAGSLGQGGVGGMYGGGGGGGAGGLIGLDSPSLTIGSPVRLCANGGGGGGGGSGPADGSVQVGNPGADGCTATPAGGGSAGGSGGHGGNGNGTTLAGQPGGDESVNTDSSGGGGGGGGAGYIYVHGNITPTQLDMMASVSPPAQ